MADISICAAVERPRYRSSAALSVSVVTYLEIRQRALDIRTNITRTKAMWACWRLLLS